MKEKIGIEKLVELYYEYELDLLKREMRVNGATEREIEMADIEKVEGEGLEGNLNKLSELKPFIKWLVEHNKLLHPDFVQHLKLFYGDSMPESNFYLMMLSIADRPIYELNRMLRP